jgi:hypothetical protein
MYARLNENIDLLCSQIDPVSDIRPYVQLTEILWKTNVSADDDFQRTYRKYWQLNAARLGSQFVSAYFTYFENLKQANEIALERVVRDLFEIPTHGDGRQSVQFSFASKMVHMLRPRVPVYDSMVEAFFFLPSGSQPEKMERKLKRLLESHRFLTTEYDRVLREGLLRPAITTFRTRFCVGNDYTDEKIIDTLIWKFVSFARSGAIRDRAISYRAGGPFHAAFA